MSLDTPDYTPWFRERPVDTKEYNREGDIDPGIIDIICDLPRHDVTIQRLCMGTSHRMVELRIFMYLEDLTLTDELEIVEPSGADKWHVTPSALHNRTSDIFDLLVYDLVNLEFKFCLNRLLRCAHGVKIEVNNNTAAIQKVAFELSILDRGIKP